VANLTTAHPVTASVAPHPLPSTSTTRALLTGGLIAGPLFILASLAQILTREGFDLKRHAISMLTLGDLGWIQSANFELTGLLVIACAVGLRCALQSGRGALWGPLLFVGYGLGLVVAGIFRPDPGLGFPPGAPADMPATMSTSGILHTLGFFVSFISLIVACFVFVNVQVALLPACRFTLAGNDVLVPVVPVLPPVHVTLVKPHPVGIVLSSIV